MPLNRSQCFFAFLVTLLIMGVAQTGESASKQDELLELEKNIRSNKEKTEKLRAKSDDLAQEAVSLRAELIALSQSVQHREANVTRLEETLAQLKTEERRSRRDLETRHNQSVETLMALQRLALNPPEAIIAQPQPPADMVRSAILLRTIVPKVQQQAETLRKDVEQYALQREKLEAQKHRLNQASLDLEGERAQLQKLIDAKKALSEQYLNDSQNAAKRVASLSAKAENLRSLLEKIEQDKQARAQEEKRKKEAEKKARADTEEKEKQKKAKQIEENTEDADIVLGRPPSGKPIGKSKGNLTPPAIGPIVMTFGEKEKLGGNHKGISFRPRSGARVVATYDGQIAFAGPFRGYKQLLIIDHGDGFHTLLTGMERIDVAVGQWLLSGEPVGVMSSNGSGDVTLYFELRKKGAPINPLPWIRQRNAKAQG